MEFCSGCRLVGFNVQLRSAEVLGGHSGILSNQMTDLQDPAGAGHRTCITRYDV